MTITHARTAPAVDEAEVERRMSFADAALGAAGHEVTDPALRELRRSAIRGDMTTDEAIAAGIAHIDAR
ncbi:MAG: hypothetical protein V4531_05220 [Actinomycetota bacterium]